MSRTCCREAPECEDQQQAGRTPTESDLIHQRRHLRLVNIDRLLGKYYILYPDLTSLLSEPNQT